MRSSGFSPSRMRRKPAASSKVLGPRPAILSSACRERNGPLVSRWWTMALAIRSERPETRRSSGRRGGVELDADAVDRALDGGVQLAVQRLLVDVVLVLADAEGARLDLHQLGERVLEPAGDRDRAAQGDVERRQLLARHRRGGVDRGAGLGDDRHHHLVEPGLQHRLAGERLGLAAGGAVAHRHGEDAVLVDQRDDGPRRADLVRVRRHGVDDVRRHHPAGAVHHGELAAGAEAGIEPHHRHLARAGPGGGALRDWRGRRRSPAPRRARASRSGPRW